MKKKSFVERERENLKKETEFVEKEFRAMDLKVISWMATHGVNYLRYSLAIVFIWFGILKPLGMSPASELVAKTVYWVNPSWFVPFLGWWEVVIGVCLLFKPLIRLGIFLMGLQMVGTFMPLILLPEIVYTTHFPFMSLEGQYIIKNIVMISAALVIGSHVRDE